MLGYSFCCRIMVKNGRIDSEKGYDGIEDRLVKKRVDSKSCQTYPPPVNIKHLPSFL